MIIIFHRFFGGWDGGSIQKRLLREENCFFLISKSAREFKNKDNIMSDMNFDKLTGKRKGIRTGLQRSLIKNITQTV